MARAAVTASRWRCERPVRSVRGWVPPRLCRRLEAALPALLARDQRQARDDQASAPGSGACRDAAPLDPAVPSRPAQQQRGGDHRDPVAAVPASRRWTVSSTRPAIESTSRRPGPDCVRAAVASQGTATHTATICWSGGKQAVRSAPPRSGATLLAARHWRGTASRWWPLRRSPMRWRWWRRGGAVRPAWQPRHCECAMVSSCDCAPMPRAGCPVESTRQWVATDRERCAPASRQTVVVALHPTRPEPPRDARRDIRALCEGGHGKSGEVDTGHRATPKLHASTIQNTTPPE